jgi:hypothetical protein
MPNISAGIPREKTDEQIARDYAMEVGQHLEPVLHVLNRARKQGFMVNFSLGPNEEGNTTCLKMTVEKVVKLVG